MHAVLHLAVHGLRARWRGWVVFALLVAVSGGAVLAAVAGAHRTDTAYPRFLQASRASDVLVSPQGTGFGGYYDALGRLPGVPLLAPRAGLLVAPLTGPGGMTEVAATGAMRRVRASDRDPQAAGRAAAAPGPGGRNHGRPDRGAELHLHVGSTLAMGALPAQTAPPSPAAVAAPERAGGRHLRRPRIGGPGHRGGQGPGLLRQHGAVPGFSARATRTLTAHM